MRDWRSLGDPSDILYIGEAYKVSANSELHRESMNSEDRTLAMYGMLLEAEEALQEKARRLLK